MRAGGCSVQQALTNDAANIVKQAVTLAKRRGHAQVTPLHVANTMLSAPSGLLRAACLQSHSHPLQCKALELCFNVALNRLPASSSSPMLGPAHSQYPSISNALVAAFKRAQAHQRRGTIENQQQQPVLAVKIELEQLIISILDDPSVSRVMREAGFSSTQVKINVEKSVSLETTPQNSPTCSQNGNKVRKVTTETEQIRNEDVEIIIDNMQKSKSLVIVGECISSIENSVKGLMNRVDKGEVSEELREVKFITIPPLYTFCNLQREEVEQKIGELSCLVMSLVSKGVVLYLGDLKWVSEYRVNLEQKSYYCSVEHMIMELGKFVCGMNNGRFWLLGIATFQTYMRCRNGYNSLESVWGLHPVTIPVNSLGLSLIPDHNSEQNEALNGRSKCGPEEMQKTNGEQKLTCCAECSANFEAEAQELGRSETSVSTLSNLPPWLKNESARLGHNDEKHNYLMEELHKKWNSYCNTSHKLLGTNLTFPSSSTIDHSNPNFQRNPDHFTTWKENYQVWPYNSNPNSTTSSSDNLMETDHYIPKFKEFNSQNLNTLGNALERIVPWQKQIIPEIVGTILQCRSGMIKRKLENPKFDHRIKEETWLFFLGVDTLAKERISRELARAVFGTYSDFVTIGLSNFSDNDELRNKRGRDEESCDGYMERFAEAVSANPHRVFFLEDLEQLDYVSQMSVKKAIESGGICRESGGICRESGEEVSFCDAIVILSCESFSSGRSRAGSPRQKTEHGNAEGNYEEERVSLDLNISCDNYSVDDRCGDALGILESVDRSVLFKIQDF